MERDSRLVDAVDALTQERVVRTWIYNDDDRPERVHVENHPPLLTLLIEGTGMGNRTGGSSERGLVIDADAVELWGRIVAAVRDWNKQLGLAFDRDQLAGSLRLWHTRHDALVRTGAVGIEADNYALSTVEAWVRQITKKFEPDEIREWTEPCPALTTTDYTPHGNVILTMGDADPVPTMTVTKPCGAHRITVGGIVKFAVTINVTQRTAECAVCGTRWEGISGLMQLRYMSNVIAKYGDTPIPPELAFGGSMPDH